MKIYDLSLPIKEGMIAYPGDPTYSRETFCSLDEGAGATLTVYRFGSHTGTHIDAPAHMVRGGSFADDIPLDTLVGAVRVIHIPNVPAVTKAHLIEKDLDGAARVFIRTDNSETLRDQTSFDERFVHLHDGAARYLREIGVRLVGFDYLTVDPFNAGHHKAHDELLPYGVILLEGVDLKDVPEGDYLLVVGAIKIERSDGAPARVFLIDRREGR